MSQNIVMVFDTETSGLPPKELHKQLDKLPTIVQLSFVLFDINEKKIIKTSTNTSNNQKPQISTPKPSKSLK